MRKIFLILAFIPLMSILAGCSPTIQKSINVTRQISGDKRGGSLWSYDPFDSRSRWGKQNKESLSRACWDISISEREFNELLEKGAQIITNSYFEQTVQYAELGPKVPTDSRGKEGLVTIQWRGWCIGETYIIKARKSLINKYVSY